MNPLKTVILMMLKKAPLFLMLCVLAVYRVTQDVRVDDDRWGGFGRKPLDFTIIDESCNTSFDTHAGIALYTLGIFFCLIAIAVICEEDFKNSILLLAKGMNLPPDIAGATLMAAGTSSPELFASLVALGAPSDDVGSGTIVGSVVFNTLVIVGGSIIFAGGRTLQLEPDIMYRDSFWNTVAVVYLLGSFWDERITWYEALVANILYALYVVHMAYQGPLHAFLGRTWDAVFNRNAISTSDADLFPPSTQQEESRASAADFQTEIDHEDYDFHAGYAAPNRPGGDDDHGSELSEAVHELEHPLDVRPEGAKAWAEAICFFPWKLIFWYTIPNPASPRFKYMYAVSFTICLFWLAFLTWMMIGWATKLGCLLNIDDAIMGATVLAVGTSMPDCLTSMAVAREGQGSMAVSNAFGSNIFDILVALGFPWLLKTVISGGRDVSVQSATIGIDSALCIISELIVLISLRITNWRLTRVLGFVYCGSYLLFLVYLIGWPLMHHSSA